MIIQPTSNDARKGDLFTGSDFVRSMNHSREVNKCMYVCLQPPNTLGKPFFGSKHTHKKIVSNSSLLDIVKSYILLDTDAG